MVPEEFTDNADGEFKGNKVKVLFQRCLWHIPHQFKWYLQKDGVKRETQDWKDDFYR